MKFETFILEREQSLWENEVHYNLSESGVHPGTINDLFDQDDINEILNTELTYSPTQGSPELRDAISGLYENVSAADVLVTNGSAEANLVAILTLLSAGDELIYMVPNYLQIRGIARAIGVDVKEIALKEELNWKLDLDELESMVTEKTKMIAVCHPNNPTGSVLPHEQVKAIIDIADTAGAYVLSDEVYRGAELNGEESTSFINMGYDKAIVNCGLSKAYGFPGLRVGWTIGSNSYMHSAWKVKDHTSICLGHLSDLMATKILQPEMRQQTLARTRSVLHANLDIIQNWVDSYNNHFRFIPPEAGAMAFMSYSFDVNSTQLVERIRDEQSVLLVAGDWYGMDKYLRFGYGAKREHLIKALELSDKVFKTL